VILEKYSMGVGDRFGLQGNAQLNAFIKAQQSGVELVPVWNKSYREHSIVGTKPADVRTEADQAVKKMSWAGSYYVDADHINLGNVDEFIQNSDFFTLDVADFIGQTAPKDAIDSFVDKYSKYAGSLRIPDIDKAFAVTTELIREIACKYFQAVREAGKIFRHIESIKGTGNFITEVSMDETDQPQTPLEMFFILAAISDEYIPAQTIAPKFTGRFNKGVDYVGDVAQFEKEFNDDVAVINFAVKEFGLPQNLKLSIHSGSDKFSIYAPINRVIKKFNAGLHVKTAGTTWLEELIGLAESGGDGLETAREIYFGSLDKFEELCAPYATVIDIDKSKLPTPEEVGKWDGSTFASAIQHDLSCSGYNPNLRQLLHVGYKVAAQMGDRYLEVLRKYEEQVAANVTKNIYQRHILPIFAE